MTRPEVKLWSGLTASKVDIDKFLETHLPQLDTWRRAVKASVPQAELDELCSWGFLKWSYKSTPEYTIVVAVAIAALNRPDKDPEQVLKNLQHAASSRGTFLEILQQKQA
ncbi:MAG: hypothetical protein JWM46_79 [Candidatus Kaiserbacteria bacterium]|nr:hypothetical protein [Candidatus Kaiserbacteria bacterium]